MYIFLIQNIPDNPRIPEEQLPAVMREQLADFGGTMGKVREQVTDPNRLVYRPFGSLLVPPPWYRDRVLLVGDAAHTCTPQMASGAGIAIEDTIVLTELLQSDGPLPDVLETFMARRYERCRLVVESSYQLATWEKSPGMMGADPVGLLARANAALAAPI
jgi:2-polyprenyl-6-methoxyphenol hydroxylase-like FAD-dependent oxidoreductase